MRRLGAVFLACAALLALYLAAWPVPVDPVAWQAPQDKGLTGALQDRDEPFGDYRTAKDGSPS